MAQSTSRYCTRRLGILATNRLGHAVFSEMYVQPQRPVNFGRFVFLDPRAETFYRDWDVAADQTVALLRGEAGRASRDRVADRPPLPRVAVYR